MRTPVCTFTSMLMTCRYTVSVHEFWWNLVPTKLKASLTESGIKCIVFGRELMVDVFKINSDNLAPFFKPRVKSLEVSLTLTSTQMSSDDRRTSFQFRLLAKVKSFLNRQDFETTIQVWKLWNNENELKFWNFVTQMFFWCFDFFDLFSLVPQTVPQS